MKTPNQEITDVLMANSGNRLTPELIAGLQARFHYILEKALSSQTEKSEKQDG
ncbi:hypothetical protein P0F23_003458 [Vibrio metschnikovii]|nr:hypothetical protein [Vibrio metschnikovii]EKO3895969.1 hypothetical protein [Vibrio metschnikovii]